MDSFSQNESISLNDDSTYTGSVATDRLMYSFWGIRFIIYVFFLIINSAQTIFELLVVIEKKNVNTRFFTYLSMALFCICRVIGDIFRFVHPYDYEVGTYYYFFFAIGVYFVLIEWVFIAGFWMQLLYTFFISDDIRLGAVRRVWIVSYALVIIYFCWQIPVEIACLYKDLTLLEAIGFFGFFILFAAWVVFNGISFVRGMKNSQKKNKMKHFEKIIRKTKILISTCIVSVIIIVTHDIVFNFVLDKEYKFFPISTFITMTVDVGQMIVVMIIMADRRTVKNYVLFRRVRNIASKSGSTSMDSGSGVQSIDLSKKYESSNMDSFRMDTDHSNSFARTDSYTFSAYDRKPSNLDVSNTNSQTNLVPARTNTSSSFYHHNSQAQTANNVETPQVDDNTSSSSSGSENNESENKPVEISTSIDISNSTTPITPSEENV